MNVITHLLLKLKIKKAEKADILIYNREAKGFNGFLTL